MTYSMKIAGLDRELPICKVTDDLYMLSLRKRWKEPAGLE